jgi:hypothetical protein
MKFYCENIADHFISTDLFEAELSDKQNKMTSEYEALKGVKIVE